MPRFFATLLMITLGTNACLASEGDDQANSFAKIYASLCMKNLPNLEALREKLRPIPSLPPEKAALFLAGNPGDAWSVPDKYGTFVLALPSGKNFCAVHVRRASTETAIKLFTGMVANPPSPFISTLVKNEQTQSPANGQIQTLSYEWSVPSATRKMLFTLTTATSESAQLQVLGSAAIISQ
ncbi:NMCC_0638 family (lipo)protein [Pseudomonas sp. LB3P58]